MFKVHRRYVPSAPTAVLTVVMLATALGMAVPTFLAATLGPGKSSGGFRLFSRAEFRWVGNRTQCFVRANGEICTPESSITGGGYWPAGTNNQYIFNTGLQMAGVVDPASAGNPWSGDIEGAFFYNARGGGNGEALTEIYSSSDPADLASWPLAAYVPCSPAHGGLGDPNDPNSLAACSGPSDETAALFNPAVQGRKTVSDSDIWFLTWEGEPNLSSGRGHPLGLLVETRGLAYNTPGKNDILFFIHTFYNISASDPAVYAGAPARLRPFLEAAGQRFHSLNAARGDTLPAGGYTILDMFLAVGTDMDVTFEEAGTNYSSVNVPLGLGYTYHASFTAPTTWTFDPSIYQPPFFAGAGFAGIKYLKTPAINGAEVGMTVFTATTGGGQFSDPRNTQQLYRYLTGRTDPQLGDDMCNQGDVTLTRICFVPQGNSQDARFFQGTGPLALPPGGYSSIAVAYIFAAPVSVGACNAPNACGQLPPQSPTGSLRRFTSPDSLANGVNTVDVISGYLGYAGDRGPNNGPADGVFNTYDLLTVPGSLLGKAQLAQVIFDGKFTQPAAPKAPNFFLIPGADQVTVAWQPSPTELQGDLFASLTDPNYRTFDVAGYRIYRGTSTDPSALRLLVQFDKLGDSLIDHTGQVNTTNAQGFTLCAPDLNVYITCSPAGTNPAGVRLITPRTIRLDGPVVQYQTITVGGAGLDTVTHTDVDSLPRKGGPVFIAYIDSVTPPNTPAQPDTIWGQEIAVATRAYASQSDTAITGRNSGRPGLSGTNVPFIFVDRADNCALCGVSRGRTYYYMVSAFDLNSIRSGPSSLESSLVGAQRVVPQVSPSNISGTGTQSAVRVAGRHGLLPAGTAPTLDATTGRFSGPFPPSNSASISLPTFLPQVLPAAGAVRVTLDSIALGDPANFVAHTFYWHSGTFAFMTSIAQDFTEPSASALALYDAVQLDPTLAGRYGGGAGYKLQGALTQLLVGAYYAGIWGRGCTNSAAGFVPASDQAGCDYNGPRWFNGPSPANNETKADPIAGNGQNFAPGIVDNSPVVGGIPNGGFNNAGKLTGVEVIHQVVGYNTVGNQWRNIEGIMAGAKRAADYNVYWNVTTAGLIDSVIDVTHDVAVPLSPRMGATYGILTAANAQPSGVNVSFDQRAELSLTDFGCVEPMRSLTGAQLATNVRCGGAAVGDGPVYALSQQATIGNIVHFTGTPANSQTSTNLGTGFAIYLPGSLFMFQTSTLPQGVVWSMRDYVGAITGGNGYGGNDGPYRFYEVLRPFSAVGASLELSFTTSNTAAAATNRSLESVHTVPDPFYLTNTLDAASGNLTIRFVNLPDRAIVRIYSSSGVLVRVLEHNSPTSGELTWDVRARNGRFVASGVYFYHIEALNARRVGRMTIITAESRR